jgi:hypothetical protein
MFVDSQTLSPEAATGVILVPPFSTKMYVANTAYHSIVEIPVALNPDRSVSVAGKAQVLTTVSTHPTALRSTATTISGSTPISRTRSTLSTPTSSRREARS